VLRKRGSLRGRFWWSPSTAARSYGYNSVYLRARSGCTMPRWRTFNEQVGKQGQAAPVARTSFSGKLLGSRTAFSG